MKNYWLQNYRKRNANYWTAEFSSNNCYILSPRRIYLLNSQNFNYFKGNVCLIFKNAVIQNDQALTTFFSACQSHIENWTSKLSRYDTTHKIESYELYDLSYDSLILSSNFEDLILKFDYDDMKYFPEKN